MVLFHEQQTIYCFTGSYVIASFHQSFDLSVNKCSRQMSILDTLSNHRLWRAACTDLVSTNVALEI